MFADFTLYDYLHVIRKKYWIILEVIAITALIVCTSFFHQKKSYTSTAAISVKNYKSVISTTSSRNSAGNYIEIMRSNPVNDAAADLQKLFCQTDFSADSEIISFSQKHFPLLLKSMKENIIPYLKTLKAATANNTYEPSSLSQISPLRSHNIISFSTTGHSAAYSRIFLLCYIECAAHQIIALSQSEKTHKKEFLQEKIYSLAEMIDQNEKKMKSFLEKSTLSAKNRQSILSNLEKEYTAAKLEYEKNRFAVETLKTLLEKNEFDIPVIKKNTDSFSALKTELSDLSSQYVSLQVQYKESHPQLRELLSKIMILKNEIRENLKVELSTTTENPYKEQIADSYISLCVTSIELNARMNAVYAVYQKKKREHIQTPSYNFELEKINRTLQTAEKSYATYATELSMTDSELNYTDIFSFFDIPYTISDPYYSKMIFSLLLAIASGTITGIALIFFTELIDKTIKSPEEAKHILKRKVFSVLPEVRFSSMLSDASPELLCVNEPFGNFSEQIRLLQTNIMHHSARKSQSILVTSADPDDGKTLIAANLAYTFAASGKKTLLIDADLRKSAVHKLFSVDNTRGISDILSGNDIQSCITGTEFENLSLLLSGTVYQNPSAFFDTADFKTLCSNLKEQFDVIIFDTPALLAVSDTLQIIHCADTVLYTIGIRETTRQHAKKTMDMLSNLNVDVAGIICNRASLRNIAGYYYRY